MKRKLLIMASLMLTLLSCSPKVYTKRSNTSKEYHPLAIAMWDFSWLERRWPGAGFEDWDQVLDEFKDLGYNAVRIEAYPQLIAADPDREWVIEEVWNNQCWGSPDVNVVRVQPALNEFLAKCKERDIMVGLSSWYRKDTSHVERKIKTPEDLADIWIATLKSIEEAGLLDVILYTDLCNEWPRNPFFRTVHPDARTWDAPASQEWMRRSIEKIEEVYPDMPLTFSFDNIFFSKYDNYDAKTDYLDLFEHHVWMMKQNRWEFLKESKYTFNRFSAEGYKNLVKYGEAAYRAKPEYWNNILINSIQELAEKSANLNKPLITTECWAVVDYKDWPLLKWDWVMDLCEIGVKTSAATGQWVAIATSNFCEPQFVGMWREKEWHKRMTTIIKEAKINPDLIQDPQNQKLFKRMKKTR